MSLRASTRAGRRTVLASLAAAAVSLLPAPALHAQLQLTTESAASSQLVLSAPVAGVSFGQIFTLSGADQQLESFRLAHRASQALPYQARLLRWTGTRAGALLWEGALQTEVATANTTSPVYETFLVNTLVGGSGQQYIFLLSFGGPASGAASLETFSSTSNAASPNPYAGGSYAFKQSHALSALQTNGDWFVNSAQSYDLGFSANFVPPVTTAPEPATFALLVPGVLALGVVRRARRRT